MEDNGTCIHPIAKGTRLACPGWGGAYAGSKVRCAASHDLRSFAQPDACKQYKRWLGGTSFEPFDRWPAPHKDDKWPWMKL